MQDIGKVEEQLTQLSERHASVLRKFIAMGKSVDEQLADVPYLNSMYF